MAYRIASIALLLLTAVGPCAAAKHALLIGIQSYSLGYKPDAGPKSNPADGAGPSRFEIPKWEDLDGSLNDVDIMRSLLTSSKFAFPGDAENMRVLPEREATHDGILAAMRKYLVERPAPGDTVVFYYAGHGSLRKNSQSVKRASKLDNTIVPIDAGAGGFDVRDREIARIFNAALDKKIRLTAIFDSCNSGTIARGPALGAEGKTRYLAYDPRDIKEAPDQKDGREVVAPEDRTDNPAVVFSATQPDQLSHEKNFDGQAHGAFTLALFDSLRALPANTSAADLYKRVKVMMEGMGLTSQQPMLSNSKARLQQPLLGEGSTDGKIRAAVLKVADGVITLDAGLAANLGPGTELESAGKAHIRVRSLQGLTRSVAEQLSPKEAKVAIGDLFEVTKWAPPPGSRLAVWTGTANLSYAEIHAAAREFAKLVDLVHVVWVVDPTLQAPTHLITWEGREWALTRSGSSDKISLGARPQARDIAARLTGTNLKLLANLPPPAELASKWKIGGPESLLENAAKPASAAYVLAGTAVGGQLQYTWLRRVALEQGLIATRPEGADAACSADSPYPLRSDWIAAPAASELGTTAQSLSDRALNLAKIHGWLEMPAGLKSSADFPYSLALRRTTDRTFVTAGPVVDGETFHMVLRADRTGPVSPRWVYVFALFCNGSSALLFPNTSGENRLPGQDGLRDGIPLGRDPVEIQKPFGIDTYILLTTVDQLPDLSAFTFDGAATRGAEASNPLNDLLRATTAGTRGAGVAVPADWGIRYLPVQSEPKRQ